MGVLGWPVTLVDTAFNVLFNTNYVFSLSINELQLSLESGKKIVSVNRHGTSTILSKSRNITSSACIFVIKYRVLTKSDYFIWHYEKCVTYLLHTK